MALGLISFCTFPLVEYLLRVWACTLDDSGLYSHPLRGRLRFMLTPLNLIDLAVILPFYAGTLAGMDLRFLRLIRLLWILKITRYLPAMGDLGRVFKRERGTLFAIMTLMLIMIFIASSLIFRLPVRPRYRWHCQPAASPGGYGQRGCLSQG